MYSIQLVINDQHEKKKLTNWIHEEFDSNFQIISTIDSAKRPYLLVIEISKLLDWVHIRRLKKQNEKILILPLINAEMLHTVPLAMQLQLQFLFIKPIKKNFFIRSIKRALTFNEPENNVNEFPDGLHKESMHEVFLRRLLRGDIHSDDDIIEYSSSNPIPNTVYFIQGFVMDSCREDDEGWQAPDLIQKVLMKHMVPVGGQVTFIPYRKHLLMLMRLPSVCVSPINWKQGESSILMAIEELENDYGIHLYIGVGSIYSEPLDLHHSYKEARKARRSPPHQRLCLRYYEKTAKDPQIQKSIEYIAKHYFEDFTAAKVASLIGFSPTYFSRMFKKETGRSFVEYVTFLRLQRGIYLMRHSTLTIEQIAEELGFNTPNYFSNIFKKYAGLSPSDYRGTKEILFY